MKYTIAVTIIALLGAGYTFYYTQMTSPSSAQVVTLDNSPRKNGTYKTETTNRTPTFSTYKMDVSLTLANNIVTAATVAYSQGAEKDPNAKRFEDAYKSEVIGKDINTINLSRVGGASLTSNAFNQALAAIRTQSKA